MGHANLVYPITLTNVLCAIQSIFLYAFFVLQDTTSSPLATVYSAKAVLCSSVKNVQTPLFVSPANILSSWKLATFADATTLQINL